MGDESCEMCANAGRQRCSACSQSRYCSRECQRAGWAKHKLVCTSVQEIRLEDRPTPESPNIYFRRALYFDPEEDHPRFVWLRFDLKPVNGHFEEEPDLISHGIPTKDEDIDELRIHNNPVLNKPLHHTIRVRFRDNFLNDGSKSNQAIKPLVPKQDWRGPMICYAMKGLGEDLRESDDLDASDFPYIVQWAKIYGNDDPLTTRQISDEEWERMTPAEKAKGVVLEF